MKGSIAHGSIHYRNYLGLVRLLKRIRNFLITPFHIIFNPDDRTFTYKGRKITEDFLDKITYQEDKHGI